MTYAVAIFGLVFLILIHEAGHFAVAQLVHMRPRKFYIFFPPAIWKTTRNGVEYGLGAIPLGGYVKIPGMHRPAGQDLEAHLARAVEDDPSLKPKVAAAALALDAEHPEEARGPLQDLRTAVENADLSERAEQGANRGLTDLDDAVADDAYWRSPTWKRDLRHRGRAGHEPRLRRRAPGGRVRARRADGVDGRVGQPGLGRAGGRYAVRGQARLGRRA